MSSIQQTNQKKPKKIIKKNNQKVKNKGTGAGGAKTNENGLNFENKKNISTEFTVTKKNKDHKIITFNNYPDIHFVTGTKYQFVKYLNNIEAEFFKNNKIRLGGTILPDKWFIKGNKIIILEIKFQQGGGSVTEKLQTPIKKIEHLKERYPGKEIVYIYGLHNWFKENAKAEILYLEKDNIPIFWGDSPTFKQDIVDYIVNQL